MLVSFPKNSLQQFNRGAFTKYTGIAVVEVLIHKNQQNFGSDDIQFICADANEIELPKAHLLICKDVLQHLPTSDVLNLLKKFKQYPHCILVNDVDPETFTSENSDPSRGGYRYLDSRIEPFSLKPSQIAFYSMYREGDGALDSIKMIFSYEN